MRSSTISGIMLALMLTCTSAFAFSIQPATAWTGTVTIKSDGTIDPPSAPLQRIGNLYTLTDDIDGSTDGIIVERTNATIDGAGHSILGIGGEHGIRIEADNVTIRNTKIKFFIVGITEEFCSNATITGNTITQNRYGIVFGEGYQFHGGFGHKIVKNILANNGNGMYLTISDSIISENTITENDYGGIAEDFAGGNTIFRNNITNNGYGMSFLGCVGDNVSQNCIRSNVHDGITLGWDAIGGDSGPSIEVCQKLVLSKNVITENGDDGIQLIGSRSNIIERNNIAVNGGNGINLSSFKITYIDWGDRYFYPNRNVVSGNDITTNGQSGIWANFSSNNLLCHNNFVSNKEQVVNFGSIDYWDDGYPSGGNYWDNYNGVDSNRDGIGDTAYVVNVDNKDRYPLMSPWSPLYMYDGFESGNFSRWTGTGVTSGETASVTSTLFHHGGCSAKFTSSGNGGYERSYCYKTIASSTEVYARGYFYVSQSGIADENDRFFFIVFSAGSNNLAYAGWKKTGGVVKWCLTLRHGTSYVDAFSSASPSTGRWCCVELHWKKGITDGIGEMWVNNVRVCAATGRNTAAYGNAKSVRFGLGELYGCAATRVYADCSALSGSYVGPEFLLKDSFESGGFSKWSGKTVSSGETAAVVETLAYDGLRSAKFTSNSGGGSEWACCYKTISSTSDLYARGYFRVATSGIKAEADRTHFIRFRVGSTSVAYAGWRKTGGVVKWFLTIRHGTSLVTSYSAASPALNTWYNVELHWVKSSTAGKGELWVNGALVCSITAKNTAYYGSANRVEFGLPSIVNCGATTVYCDYCAISNTRIGTT